MNPFPTSVTAWRQLARAASLVGTLVWSLGARAQAPWPEPAARPQDLAATVPTLQWNVDLRHEHDDNVLRAPAGVADDIRVFSAGLRLDKTWSLQRLWLDLQAQAFRFADQGALDYHSVDYQARWHLAVTPSVRGLLQTQRRQFRDVSATAADTLRIDRRTERESVAQLAGAVAGGWEVLAAAVNRASRSDDPRSSEPGADVRSVLVGGAHEFNSGARLAVTVRRGQGDYADRVSLPDFDETEPAFELRWPWTTRTRLDLRLSRLRRSHVRESFRDFHGTTGLAQVRTEFTPKTALEAGVGRDLGSYELGSGGQVRTSRAFIAPQWAITPKVTVRLRHEREHRRWQLVSTLDPDTGRHDRWRQSLASAEWQAMRALALSVGARRERRDSSLPAFRYDATVWTVGARLTL